MPSLVHSLTLSAWLSSTMAFSPLSLHTRPHLTQPLKRSRGGPIFSSIADGDQPSDVNDDLEDDEPTVVATMSPPDTLEGARANLLSTSTALPDASLTGVFLTTPSSINELDLACKELEAIAPSVDDTDVLIGDWDLVCTARAPKLPVSTMETSSERKEPKGWESFLPKKNKGIDTLNSSLKVQQRIRTAENSTEISRIDHVLEYTPLSLSDLIPSTSPLSSLRSWNVNPLSVSQSKITLIHSASVESTSPVLRTKLALQSVVVTVAGTSQYLDPEGMDILGVNIPSLGDWSNSGSFDTTYCDGSVRISRGKTLGLEELRVFVKRGSDDAELLGIGVTTVEEKEEKEEEPSTPTAQEERVQNFKEAVQDVQKAVEKLDSDVKGKVQDAAKGVQQVVEEDLKEISDKVTKVKNVVIGKEEEKVEEEEEEEKAVVEPVEAVAESVEEVVEEVEGEEVTEEDEADSEEETDSDSSANEI